MCRGPSCCAPVVPVPLVEALGAVPPQRSRRHRRALMTAAALCLAALPAQPAPAAPAEDLSAAVRGLEQRYRGLGAFRAVFSQDFVSSAFGDAEHTSGRVHVAPPDALLFEYDHPKGQRAALDGRQWWLVDPDLKQVVVKERPAGDVDPLMGLLSGRLDILRLFGVSLSQTKGDTPSDLVLDLLPRESRDDIELIVLVVDRGSKSIRRLEVVDPLGNRTIYRLGEPIRESPPPRERFALLVPPGFELSRQ